MAKPMFEWNPAKAKSNLQKHAVSFDEATTAFDDPDFISVVDDEHSMDEERYIYYPWTFQSRQTTGYCTHRPQWENPYYQRPPSD